MENPKNGKRYFVLCSAAVIVMTALLRLFNIYNAVVDTDVSYSDTYANIVNYSHDFLSLCVVGFVIAFIVYCGWMKSRKTAITAAAVTSAVYLLDRCFCTVYDVIKGNIALENTQKLDTSVWWMTVDFLFYAVTFFGSCFITLSIRKKLLSSENREADIYRYNPSRAVLYSTLIILTLQLVSQLYICIQFITEYDDITAIEYLQMGGDTLLTVVEYGIIVFAAASVFRTVFFLKKDKKS